MHAEIKGVAEHHVTEGTDLYADVLLDHLLDQVGEKAKLEAMTDSFGIEKHCVVNVGDFLIVCFTSVEEARHIVHTLVALSTQDHRCELTDLRSVLFFIDHVESGDQMGILEVCFLDVPKNLLRMGLADDFVACQD